MMKYKGLFLASLLLLTACDEPGGKRTFMRECTSEGNITLCDCAWGNSFSVMVRTGGITPNFYLA
jgi:hypothetical protein